MGIVVYWLEGEGDALMPACRSFGGAELVQALAWAEDRRRQGHAHVSISTELADHVGRAGVASVEGGRTPDAGRRGLRVVQGRAGRQVAPEADRKSVV